jgi:hypothetical protein
MHLQRGKAVAFCIKGLLFESSHGQHKEGHKNNLEVSLTIKALPIP